MRSRAATDATEAMGTDSFLDIVANLVGILIILVMVIGVRTQDVSESVSTVKASRSARPVVGPAQPPRVLPDVESAKSHVARMKSNIVDAEREAHGQQQQIALQRMRRDQLLLTLTKAERLIAERRSSLDEKQREQVEIEAELREARNELANVRGNIQSVETAKIEPGVIEHIATPLAQTVFAREEHFSLSDGRLAYVPLNQLAARLKSEAPKKLWKLSDTSRITETIGPRDGYYLKYTLRRYKQPVQTEQGRTLRDVVELDRFVMIPTDDDMGEVLDVALEPGSQFRRRLARWKSDETIVTVWTYPDSFADFRRLKAILYELGFLAAARPLPAGQPISGSPRGTKSAAQ